MSLESFEQLDVWKKAHAMTLQVYKSTKGFPKEELFGVTSQLRRATSSVPANIAEGFKRRGSQDKKRFYNMAQASLEEARYFMMLSRDLDYSINYDDLNPIAVDIAKMLTRMIQRL